jgi:hypothetical protein
MHELTRARGFIQGLENNAPQLTVYAAVPAEEVLAVEVWLASASNGQGKVIGNDPVDGDDA